MQKIDIGISESDREGVADQIKKLLADSYTLYLQTHNFHWNVTGTQFRELHLMFEEHYIELAEAVDEIAERIRSLGYRSPGSFREFTELTSIEEDTDHKIEAMEMVRRLAVDNEAVLRTARQVVPACDEAGDEATLDLLTQRLDVHSKTAWMLRSHLE